LITKNQEEANTMTFDKFMHIIQYDMIYL